MSRKMHILQLGPYPPPRGGVQLNMFAIREELLRENQGCSIIAITRPEMIEDEPNVYHPEGRFALVKLLFTLKYDALHIHIGGNIPLRVLLLLLACAIAANGRSVMTLHSGGYASETVEKAKSSSFEGFVFRRFTKIVVVNETMREMFERFGVSANRINLIPPFVLNKPKKDVLIPSNIKNFQEKYGKVLLTVGSLEEHYDLPTQINALEQVLQEFPSTGLIIVGFGSKAMQAELEKLIKSKPYASHILIAGDTDRDVVLNLIDQCNVFLRTTTFDGDAISVREALFLGKPVVATDTGMRPEGVRLVPKRNTDALEQALIEALSEDENRKTSVSATEDGWANIRKVIKLYEEMIYAKENKFSNKRAEI